MSSDWLQQAISNLKELALAASLISAVVGATASVAAKQFAELQAFRKRHATGATGAVATSGQIRSREQNNGDAGANVSAFRVARGRAKETLQEARDAIDQQNSIAWWSSFASILMTIGQYIVGGLLASSFVQSSLTPKLTGILGLIVLFASICKQHFHPEINASQARTRASQLRALLRSSQDEFAVLEAKTAAGQDHTDAMIVLMKRLTQGLTDIVDPQPVSKKLILVNGE